MALQDPQAEPSMEEILASIRRIISEEDEAPAAASPADEPALDLTDQAPADESDDIVFESEPEPEPAPAPEPAPPMLEAAAPAPVPTPAAAPSPPLEGIVSAPSASAAAGALARLAGTLRISDSPGQTVEGVVRELLQPMLKEWLEQNLPRIVEARVEAELERIARLAR
jgi:uncharacterized protein